ncbi:FAD binding domain-containing protein [uncultured Pseudosulfitobacter sp.]|jgi:CO/xanthine dehydrogenase FAD-binding subunit|uniref:FAD binding domain-containing protein n=1 Tax=uncultured Pseudosulfitobacter sp. TaxID=2854214 RepID=UPI0030DC6559|tara:strand:+ start:14611 stop:15447 length:837 start_codon:yes stop_codon:yes gene_type:complete
MTLHRPETLDAALALLAEGGGVVLAGGTDVYPGLRDAPAPARMIDVSAVSGLRGITRDGDHWRIGAATTWTDVVRADLPALFDGLKLAAREVGSVQIQNTGTVAGNLCNASPAADGVPALLALDAEVELTGPDGARRVPLGAFIQGIRKVDLGPAELMTAIYVPDAPGCGAFRKLGARRYLVISIAMVGAVVHAEGGRIVRAHIAVGSCSPVARRLVALETALVGAALGDVGGIVGQARLDELTPIDDVRASAAYRMDAVRTLVRRTVLDAVEKTDVA